MASTKPIAITLVRLDMDSWFLWFVVALIYSPCSLMG